MRKLFTRLIGPTPLHYLLPWFMLLLLAGTVAQRYIGLAEAQRLFFSSWILWLGPVPTPGGSTTLGILTLNLLLRLAFASPWKKETTGTLLAHLGVFLLLLGGILTYYISNEGYIALLEKESSFEMQDYYQRELTLYENNTAIAAWPEAWLKSGGILDIPKSLFSIKINHFCANCNTLHQDNPSGKHGIAAKLMLETAPPAKEREDNKAGIAFTLSHAGEADGDYLAHELLTSQAPEWEFRGKHYRLLLARAVHPLPFTLTLLEFEKLRYPGSDNAREYRSLVEIDDGGGKPWQATIAMNEPLRLHGYAIYQSSFVQMGSTQASVLAIVRNDFWLTPYLATFVLALGLLWHLVFYHRRIQKP